MQPHNSFSQNTVVADDAKYFIITKLTLHELAAWYNFNVNI